MTGFVPDLVHHRFKLLILQPRYFKFEGKFSFRVVDLGRKYKGIMIRYFPRKFVYKNSGEQVLPLFGDENSIQSF